MCPALGSGRRRVPAVSLVSVFRWEEIRAQVTGADVWVADLPARQLLGRSDSELRHHMLPCYYLETNECASPTLTLLLIFSFSYLPLIQGNRYLGRYSK
jgi:hypothetical protein